MKCFVSNCFLHVPMHPLWSRRACLNIILEASLWQKKIFRFVRLLVLLCNNRFSAIIVITMVTHWLITFVFRHSRLIECRICCFFGRKWNPFCYVGYIVFWKRILHAERWFSAQFVISMYVCKRIYLHIVNMELHTINVRKRKIKNELFILALFNITLQ